MSATENFFFFFTIEIIWYNMANFTNTYFLLMKRKNIFIWQCR